MTVPAKGYVYHVFPAGQEASWVRVTADKDCTATAYFHYASARDASRDAPATFDCLAKVSDQQGVVGGLIRPAGHNRSLQFLAQTVGADGTVVATVLRNGTDGRRNRSGVGQAGRRPQRRR